MFLTLAFLSTCSHVHYIKMHHKSTKKRKEKKILETIIIKERERERSPHI